MIKKYGMSTSQIKYVALIIMLLDHIATFIDGTPIWFKFVGRISAPLFFFCMCWGIDYTQKIKRYILRLYIASLIMALIWCILEFSNYKLPYELNNIFSTLFITAVAIAITKSTRIPMWKKVVGLIIWQAFALCVVLIAGTMGLKNSIMYLICTITGCAFYCEGGILWCLFGVILYYLKNNSYRLVIGYSIICIIGKICSMFAIFPRLLYYLQLRAPEFLHEFFSGVYFLIVGEPYQFTPFVQGGLYFGDYQWLMIGALPFMLLYNHQRGKASKWVFYIFYPLHIFLLVLLANWMNA